jgi:hypothetical protein
MVLIVQSKGQNTNIPIEQVGKGGLPPLALRNFDLDVGMLKPAGASRPSRLVRLQVSLRNNLIGEPNETEPWKANGSARLHQS